MVGADGGAHCWGVLGARANQGGSYRRNNFIAHPLDVRNFRESGIGRGCKALHSSRAQSANHQAALRAWR